MQNKKGLLVLTRRSGEVVTIGDNIEVTLVSIKGRQARIGIKAPGLPVHRAEAKLMNPIKHEEDVDGNI